MERTISYGVKVRDEGNWISIIQGYDEDCNVHISVDEIDILCKALQDLKAEMLKEEKKESFAKERKEESPSFNSMQPVLPENEFIRLTEDLIRAGMTGGVGINNKQRELLGIENLEKGWIQNLIGKGIHVDVYEQFLALKGVTK